MAKNIIALVRNDIIIALIEEGTLTEADLENPNDRLIDIPDDEPAELGWRVKNGRAIDPKKKPA